MASPPNIWRIFHKMGDIFFHPCDLRPRPRVTGADKPPAMQCHCRCRIGRSCSDPHRPPATCARSVRACPAAAACLVVSLGKILWLGSETCGACGVECSAWLCLALPGSAAQPACATPRHAPTCRPCPPSNHVTLRVLVTGVQVRAFERERLLAVPTRHYTSKTHLFELKGN